MSLSYIEPNRNKTKCLSHTFTDTDVLTFGETKILELKPSKPELSLVYAHCQYTERGIEFLEALYSEKSRKKYPKV